MSKNAPRVLAIDPGTHKMGYALLTDTELLYHGVKVFSSAGSPSERLERARHAVKTLIATMKPDVLAIENTFMSKTKRAALLNVFADEIKVLGRRSRLLVVSYAPSTVKKFITGNGWAGKDQVAQVIIQRFPELRAYLVGDRQWKRLHHENMFDAVAVGLLALHEL